MFIVFELYEKIYWLGLKKQRKLMSSPIIILVLNFGANIKHNFSS